MKRRLAYASVLSISLVLAGCNGSLEDIAPKAERPLPERVVRVMAAKNMKKDAPIMMRIFKEEGELEVWKQTRTGRYELVTGYEICKWSGKLGPKFVEGDRQAPEGFYTVRPEQMNPWSSYHLAFNIGFPNSYDRANGRTGQHLMVHGACSSAGCYSMTDEQVEEIYAFARDAFRGGQKSFQIQAFPFRMTPENMARYRNDPNYPFWAMLKEGYDHFEVTRTPPKVDVCERRYVFNRIADEGYSFEPTKACPPSTQPASIAMAYQAYKKRQDLAFARAAETKRNKVTKASIQSIDEALLVADWSRRRARGEEVGTQPPSLTAAAAVQPEAVLMSTPVSAFAADSPAPSPIVTGTVTESQTEVGAPPVEEASSTAGRAPGPMGRLRSLLGGS
ncbi:murein L,D-transpeptidase family protein [Chelativorans sp. Marseille-P2723]|uniref:L,D-transpeptidase family protein n=1 Tax=Chelativorans sp. Marseille-P2723 TaxID=2709133 RepID=UPI00157113C8|nr:murein L,D-transpeptidase family protein [Chelativorans sp. Marseille-P2723]